MTGQENGGQGKSPVHRKHWNVWPAALRIAKDLGWFFFFRSRPRKSSAPEDQFCNRTAAARRWWAGELAENEEEEWWHQTWIWSLTSRKTWSHEPPPKNSQNRKSRKENMFCVFEASLATSSDTNLWSNPGASKAVGRPSRSGRRFTTKQGSKENMDKKHRMFEFNPHTIIEQFLQNNDLQKTSIHPTSSQLLVHQQCLLRLFLARFPLLRAGAVSPHCFQSPPSTMTSAMTPALTLKGRFMSFQWMALSDFFVLGFEGKLWSRWSSYVKRSEKMWNSETQEKHRIPHSHWVNTQTDRYFTVVTFRSWQVDIRESHMNTKPSGAIRPLLISFLWCFA